MDKRPEQLTSEDPVEDTAMNNTMLRSIGDEDGSWRMTNANEEAENDSVDPLIWACSSPIKRYCKGRLSDFNEGGREPTPSTGNQPRC